LHTSSKKIDVHFEGLEAHLLIFFLNARRAATGNLTGQSMSGKVELAILQNIKNQKLRSGPLLSWTLRKIKNSRRWVARPYHTSRVRLNVNFLKPGHILRNLTLKKNPRASA
jgi:hypothetical protein